jgi:hypothetical protein
LIRNGIRKTFDGNSGQARVGVLNSTDIHKPKRKIDMSKNMIVKVRKAEGKEQHTFVVENCPESGAEADKLWGIAETVNGIFGTSPKVQFQATIRDMLNEEPRKPMKEIIEVAKTLKPSTGKKAKLTTEEKIRKENEGKSEKELVVSLMEIGIPEADAKNAAKNMAAGG